MAMQRSSLVLLALVLLAFPPVVTRAADCGEAMLPQS
ncbi:pentapeptide repeat-containing protein, partial [Rhizobium ruizarguesonis]